ncbi:ATP-binding protein [uncultured Campylobacter sp.]|jgi:sensor histidine kinase|uniref:sensor histidine kinase n=1 Tax=uncultured Campylobacter sp. TaxID=218934 RepID=UPI0025FEE58A|nr:ATP-binding protein [uncultured Campylobacter sp.]
MNDEINIQDGLKSLIEQTYLIEREYKNLNASYESLQNIIKDVVDALPMALWVLNEDGGLFLQNSQASKSRLFERLNLSDAQTGGEVNLNGSTYLIKIAQSGGKKVVSAVDITDEKRNERLASMGQVAAHLAHEIRNPIGSVSLLASTLLRRASEREKPLVEEIQSAIWRVERIIKATLLFTKGVRINARKFELSELKKECEEALKFYEYSKRINIELDFGQGFINGDKDLLAMVFENLLFNAIDAIEESEDESGDVRLSYELARGEDGRDEHKFYVRDTGVGIADTGAVFEPFKTSKLKGNGLGLALCVQIAAAHGGSMEVSLNPKTFCVSLPA